MGTVLDCAFVSRKISRAMQKADLQALCRKNERDHTMFRRQYPPFFQGQGHQIMFRQRYPIGPLIHLISLGLWIALCLLLVCVLMGLLCRKKMRMFCGHSHCGSRGYGHGRCGCGGRGGEHGHCGPTPSPVHLDALEILRRRYASGEIDDVTFQHMRERLGPSPEPERRAPND